VQKSSDRNSIALISRLFKKNVFLGEKEHDPEQSKGLETRIKTQCGNPQKTQYSAKILRWKFPTSSGAPCRRAPTLSVSSDMLERWPHFCRFKVTFTLLPTNHFVSTTTISMKCIVKWIPLRIRVLSTNTQPQRKKLQLLRAFGHVAPKQ